MVINIKKTDSNATIPTRGSDRAAGFDLYSNETSVDIPAGETKMIGTGVCMEIPDGYAGLVYARSGLASKRGLRPANRVGVIDSDYRGEIKVALHNDSKELQTINIGDRLAQIVITPFLAVSFNEVNELNATDRGEGGFGSTGINSTPKWHQMSIDEADTSNTYQQNT